MADRRRTLRLERQAAARREVRWVEVERPFWERFRQLLEVEAATLPPLEDLAGRAAWVVALQERAKRETGWYPEKEQKCTN